MNEPTVCLCSLVLNEMEWLEKLYHQHKDWPGLLRWVFVEAADRVYAETNPTLVTAEGLSVDGTSHWLEELARKDSRVAYIPHGLTSHFDPAQGKCAARTRYLRSADEVQPTYLGILDGDEFWPRISQETILRLASRFPTYTGFAIQHREIWHPPSLSREPLFTNEVRNGFWAIPYVRLWRWEPGLVYLGNHNTPEKYGEGLDYRLKRFDRLPNTPEYVHLAFASCPEKRLAKNAYYEARGEGLADHRKWYCESRAAWKDWRQGDLLPNGARVIPYRGPIPEVFQ